MLLSIQGIDEVLTFRQIKNNAHHTVLLITICLTQMAVYMTVENTRILDPLPITAM